MSTPRPDLARGPATGLKTLVASALATGCALFAGATSLASADDPGACAFNGRYLLGLREYQCPPWRGDGPVDAGHTTGSRVAR